MASIIFEGVDGSGKSSMLECTKNFIETNLHQIVLTFHCENFRNITDVSQYQQHSIAFYTYCMKLIKECPYGVWYLFDRCHLGEVVYSPMYRKYSGDYVFNIEKEYQTSQCGLVLATAHTPEIILDRDIKRNDGKSFTLDPVKKLDEMNLFERAFDLSNISKKVKIYQDDAPDAQAIDNFNKYIKPMVEKLNYQFLSK